MGKFFASSSDGLRLRLLGPAQVEVGNPPVRVELAAHKGAALMFYLAARADQPVTRTRLIALLWEDSDEQEGRNSPEHGAVAPATCSSKRAHPGRGRLARVAT